MSSFDEEKLRLQILRYCKLIYDRGWVANHDGNLTARLGDGKLLCTPTAVSKGDVSAEMLITVDKDNKVLSGTRRAFSELQLHRAAYKARPDIGCVIHSHPPTACGFAVTHTELDHTFMVEPIVSLGSHVPLVPFFPPGDPQLDAAIGEALQKSDALLLASHGVLTVGGSFEQAYLRMELVEHLCKISLVARQLGGAKPLPSDVLAKLSKRKRPASVPNYDPSWKPQQQSPNTAPKADVQQIVENALRRLGKP